MKAPAPQQDRTLRGRLMQRGRRIGRCLVERRSVDEVAELLHVTPCAVRKIEANALGKIAAAFNGEELWDRWALGEV